MPGQAKGIHKAGGCPITSGVLLLRQPLHCEGGLRAWGASHRLRNPSGFGSTGCACTEGPLPNGSVGSVTNQAGGRSVTNQARGRWGSASGAPTGLAACSCAPAPPARTSPSPPPSASAPAPATAGSRQALRGDIKCARHRTVAACGGFGAQAPRDADFSAEGSAMLARVAGKHATPALQARAVPHGSTRTQPGRPADKQS